MTELVLYNTLARAKQAFRPIEPGRVRMYVCGMTVYDYCHLGHARVLVAFDVITRYLRACGYDVEYVRNITDVDDKILKRALEQGKVPEELGGYSTRELVEKLPEFFIQAMHQDERDLGVLPPDHEPRVTQHMADIIAMIEVLIKKGYAYEVDNGDVYYSVLKFADYGKLSGKNPEELRVGARVEIGELKRDPRDFALWKSAKSGEPMEWKSPWGWGRPGWHIECSAMSRRCLGEHFDIHGGGPDLPFPHHENEIAQSEAANDCAFANYWMHAGAVRVDGEKMSKSLGNFFTIRTILERYRPEEVRYLLISSHYRSQINYSDKNLEQARAALERFYIALRGLGEIEVKELKDVSNNQWKHRFVAAMNDDFNTPEALAVLYELVREINTLRHQDLTLKAKDLAGDLVSLSRILGFLKEDPESFFKRNVVIDEIGPISVNGMAAHAKTEISDRAIQSMIDERNQARKSKNFAQADAVRDELAEQGITLEDGRDGTTWRRE